jgi:hypothetical protein
MKKFGNFGKVFGMMAAAAAVFAFAIGGCEQPTETVIIPQRKTPEVRNSLALKEALASTDITDFAIPVSLDTKLEVTVTSTKVITIPPGVVVAFKSLTTQADVTVIGPPATGAAANSVVLASVGGGADNGEAGIILIKERFAVEADTNFDLKGNAKLAFHPAVTPVNAVVDGALTAENEGSIFWVAGAGEEAAAHTFSGGGSVKTSAGAVPVVAEEAAVTEQYIPQDEPEEEAVEEEEEPDPFDDENYVNVPVNSVTVNYAESGLAVAQGGLSLAKEQTVQLTAETDPAGIAVTWFSGKKSVATVEDGLVTAVKAGQAQIMAKAGNVSAIIDVTVIAEKTAGLYVGAEIAGSNPKEYTYDDEIDISARTEATTLARAFGYIKEFGSDNGVYLILLDADETDVAGYSIGRGVGTSSTGDKKNLKITLQGMDGKNIAIQKSPAQGALFTVYGDAATDKPELVLGENITLKGISGNNKPLVVVGNTESTKVGTLTMLAGSRITGNISSSTNGGVLVALGGTFIMEDGMIDGNEATNNSGTGGGVGVAAIFTMNGGSIKGNKAGNTSGGTSSKGGGVNVVISGTFRMNGGTIEDNMTLMKDNYNTGAGSTGGGVNVAGTFTMKGNATIKNNTAAVSGGGVAVSGIFVMQGGSIEGNTVGNQRPGRYGAAVGVWPNTGVKFTKSGGVIYGNGTENGDSIPQGKENKAAEGTSVNAIDVLNNSVVSAFRNFTAGENTSLDSTNTSGGNSGWSIPD